MKNQNTFTSVYFDEGCTYARYTCCHQYGQHEYYLWLLLLLFRASFVNVQSSLKNTDKYLIVCLHTHIIRSRLILSFQGNKTVKRTQSINKSLLKDIDDNDKKSELKLL